MPDSPLNCIEHLTAVAKLDLAFGGMHVYIYFGRAYGQEDHSQWVTANRQQGMIRLGNCVGERSILDPASVDKKGNVAAIGTMQSWCADIAGY
jgi:hypothetical protein